MKRRGISIIEVIVAVAIVAILLALLLPAVQNVRQAAARAQLLNKLRQLSIATLSLETGRGELPSLDPASRSDLPTLLLASFGYRTGSALPPEYVPPEFVSPLDPTYNYFAKAREGNSSFGFNHLIFRTAATTNNVPDGRSNTVMISERYARCGPTYDSRTAGNLGVDVTVYGSSILMYDASGKVTPVHCTTRPISFVELYTYDIIPVYNPASRTSLGSIPDASVPGFAPSVPGVTFQVAPRPDACDPRVVQASTHAGLVVGMMDGSVRTVAPSVAPAVYWSSLTPDKGEAVSLD